MSDIQVGDRVQWQRRGRSKGTMVSGTVTEIYTDPSYPEDPLVVIKGDLSPLHIKFSSGLTRVPATVPGVIEAVVDDYTFAVGQAGSLGGVEL